MNKYDSSLNWNHVRAFLATVEEGSLSAASRMLNLTQPTLGRQIAALEDRLKIVLFERVGKSLVLTPSGIDLLDHARSMQKTANDFSLAASGQSQDLEGEVNITTTDMLSSRFMPSFVKEIHDLEPLLKINIIAANDIRDLQGREADIAIRHVRPHQVELITKLITEVRANLYASEEYLSHRGRPALISDLINHDFISLADPKGMVEALNAYGIEIATGNFRFGASNTLTAWEMAKIGLGIIMMSEGVAAAEPSMERVLPSMEPILFPVWLVAHRELHTSRRVRLVYDHLAQFLAKQDF